MVVVCGGTGVPAGAAVETIAVSGIPWGTSPCYVGATEGNINFDMADLWQAEINTYRVYGGMHRWEWVDDDAVYGSPTIAEIKADPNVVDWAWWDDVMTNPNEGSDYWWSGTPGTVWPGNARTLFQELKDAGIEPVVTLRNVDNNDEPQWAHQLNPPVTAEDWNEWWEHVFATVYWFNVRNDYQIDRWEVHNEPDNAGQGWGGTIEDYFLFVEYTYDAVKHVYDTYLPGRTFHVLAPSTKGGSSWPRDVLINAGAYFDSVDIHSYSSDTSSYTAQVHEWMDQYGASDWPLWNTEWGTYRGQYDSVSFGVKVVLNNLIRYSQPGPTHVDGSHLFAFYDWDGFAGAWQNFDGIVGPGGERRASFWALRLAGIALKECRTTFESVPSNPNLLAITTQDEDYNVYLLVTNSGRTAYTIDADLSALVHQDPGYYVAAWEFSAANLGGSAPFQFLDNYHVILELPGTAAVLFKVKGGPPATPEPSMMHVSDVTMGYEKTGINYRALATVTIVDAFDVPVNAATVYGTFSWASADLAIDDTGFDGTVTLESSNVRHGGSWSFCVIDVVKEGWIYDKAANVERCGTITAP
jgi:hypothetical protein